MEPLVLFLQQQYYMQQPAMYVDQNGQPIYYQQDPNMQPQMQYVQAGFNAQGQPQMVPVMMSAAPLWWCPSSGAPNGGARPPPCPMASTIAKSTLGVVIATVTTVAAACAMALAMTTVAVAVTAEATAPVTATHVTTETTTVTVVAVMVTATDVDAWTPVEPTLVVTPWSMSFAVPSASLVSGASVMCLDMWSPFAKTSTALASSSRDSEVCDDDEKELVFQEILPVSLPLMTDVFGNYVLQKLFEYGTPDQCEQLGLLLAGQAVQLSMQMYGCRVVQKALEYVNTERLMALVSEFEDPPVLLRCVHDSNGNHVIQKCIEIVSRVSREAQTPEAAEFVAARIQFIIDTFKGRVKELSSTLTAAEWCSASSSTVPTSKSKSFWRSSASAARTSCRTATATTLSSSLCSTDGMPIAPS